MKALAGLDKHIYSSVVRCALTASSEESLVLVNHCLQLLVVVLTVVSCIGKLTDELHRLLSTCCEIIDLVVSREIDDALEVLLPEVVIDCVLHGVAVLDADIELRGKLMEHLQLVILWKLSQGLRDIECGILLSHHTHVRGESEVEPVLTDHLLADAVNRADHGMVKADCLVVHALIEEERLSLLLELVRSLCGEGGEDDLLWLYLACLDQVSKCLGECMGLTATCTCIDICYVLHGA